MNRPVRTAYRDAAGIYHPAPDSHDYVLHRMACDRCAEREHLDRAHEAEGGRTIRNAIIIALEAVAGDPQSSLAMIAQGGAPHLHSHVLRWVHDYARHRGVILDDHDITGELMSIIAALRGAS